MGGLRQRLARRRLEAGPWCWPVEAEAPDVARSSPGDGPPALEPGIVPLVAVQEDSVGHLLRLCLGKADLAGGEPFGSKAEAAWRVAAFALPRSLPVLWADVREVSQLGHTWGQVDNFSRDYTGVKTARSADGDSFGLGFLLAMTSRLLGRALPEDLIATGAVSADGRVEPVDGIALKCRTTQECAPRIRRILVPSGQEGIAREELGEESSLQVIGVGTAFEAVIAAFTEEFFFEFLTMRAEGSEERKREIVDFYFRATMVRGRSSHVVWDPLARGAAHILESWQLPDEARWRLEFARGIAARHAGGREPIRLPTRQVLDGLPLPLRIGLLAQFVQHGVDVEEPNLKELTSLVSPRIETPIREAFREHLALRGAWARLLAVRGEPRRALDLQQEITAAWIERLEYDQTSFQLSEWYRLTGALAVLDRDFAADEAAASLAEADDRRAFIEARAGLDPVGARYVDLARGRCLVEMSGARVGRWTGAPLDEAEEILRAIERNPTAPDHVRYAARRFLLAICSAAGKEPPAGFELPGDRADGAPAPNERGRTSRRFQTLARLDDALRSVDVEARESAVRDMAALDPGPTLQLIKAAPQDPGPAAYVAALYPY